MKHLCKTCDWFEVAEGEIVIFDTNGDKKEINIPMLECHKESPTIDGFPRTREDTGCGEHSAYSELPSSRPFGRLPSSEYQGPGVPIEIKDISMADGPTKMGGTATVIIGDKEISIPVSPDDTSEDVSERLNAAIAKEYPPGGVPVTVEPMADDEQAVFGGSVGAGKTASRDAEIRENISREQAAALVTGNGEPIKRGHMERIHDPNAFKVGDRVRVVGVAESREGGWNCDWVPEMGECIGKEFKITNTYNDASGFCLGWDSTCCWFPSFVLEKVTDDPKPEGPRNEEYSP